LLRPRGVSPAEVEQIEPTLSAGRTTSRAPFVIGSESGIVSAMWFAIPFGFPADFNSFPLIDWENLRGREGMNTGSLTELISSVNLGSLGEIYWPPDPIRWLTEILDALANVVGSLGPR